MRASEDVDPADLMRFCIFSPDLDKLISTCLWRVHSFTAEMLNAFDDAIEPNEELYLDETLRMEITTIRQPVYQCRKCCRVIRSRDCPKDLHVCGSQKCPSCQKFVVLEEHVFCLPRASPKKSSSDIIFSDLETGQSSEKQVVNFAIF
ncbi:hypothetical protein AVEN_19646-1 [Araneus ventricosus]|uniref:Uncharacterized protein n=1 Tax=Araneus ventricosus TaxID=182803 RepID=A0A4Y2C5J6_ARAVE|nr:hypothetical protein AVEN_19646-1 [Araneus ventricosus]